MTHYVYEIIGDKVGSTTRYPERPIEQGALEGEFKLLWQGTDKEEMLKQEVLFQDKLGYKKDPFHGHLTFKQKEGAHTMTIVKDEKKLHTLLQNKSVTLDTEYGKIKFKGQEEIQAFSDTLATGPYGGWFAKVKLARNLRDKLNTQDMNVIIEKPCNHENEIPEFKQIRDWATDKGIFTSGDPKTQYVKLQEEAGELAKAILNNDEPEIIDGLGDVLVVLINLSHLCGYKLEGCLATAYDVIKKRKGKMVDGTFIKDE